MKKARSLVFCALCIGSIYASSMYAAGSLVADDIQSLVHGDGDITRDPIALGDGDPIVLNGYALFDIFGNIVSGSLVANSSLLSYDTAAFHDNFTIASTFKRSPYPQTIFISNGSVFVFRNQSYTAAQIASGAVVPIIKADNIVFHKGVNNIAGFVGFNGGFTILPDASASLSTFITVTGPLDLRDTGTLQLGAELTLASHLTVSSGGGIDGQGNTIILGGNISLPLNKIFHIMSNTVVNGNGYTLRMGDYGQLFVDNNMTLTLQNITLVSGAKTAVFPPIRCAGNKSNLVFDNVTLAPGADIPFYQGQLFIYDAVHFTGTSALVYASPQSSFIMPDASLYFDTGTTFSFAPATASKNQIVMSNATSSLVLNGCTLKVTDTGLQLTKGTLTYQGSVTLDTKNGLYLSTISTTSGWISTSGTIFEQVAWHPSGRFLAAPGTNAIKIYSFDGTSFVNVKTYSLAGFPSSLSWSSDGRFLAAGPVTGAFWIYQFDVATATLTNYATPAYQLYGAFLRSLSWSPDGRHIAVGGSDAGNGKELQIFRFNGIGFPSVVSQRIGASDVYMAAWDPSGNFIAEVSNLPTGSGGFGAANNANAGSSNGPNRDCLRIYKFLDATMTLTPVTSISYSSSGYVHGIAWSPDGAYLTIAGSGPGVGDPVLGHSYNMSNSTDMLRVYRFNYNESTPKYSIQAVTSRPYGSYVWQGVDWSPDGKTIAYCGTGPINGGATGFNDTNNLRIYTFDGTTLIPAASCSLAVGEGYSCKWHPSGNMLVVGMGATPSYFHGIFPMFTPNLNQQALTNSLVYGNSSIGNSANLTVNGSESILRGSLLNQNA